MKINPFNPNSPVNPGMFIGRLQEVRRLENALAQTRANKPAHFVVTGERGIGKSSLLLYLMYVADGSIKLDDSMKANYLVISLDIELNTTQIGLIKRIEHHLNKKLGESESARSFMKDIWSFVQRIKIQGSGLDSVETEDHSELIIDEFATSLATTAKRICDEDATSIFSAQYDGILILIDEADNCSQDLQLGSFTKLLLERIQRQNCNRVAIGLFGLPELSQKLTSSHPSSLRIYEELKLNRLTDQEVEAVIDMCMERACEDNKRIIKITDEAKTILRMLSEGYPHFIQQFGYSAFDIDDDDVIDNNDVEKGSFGPHGALEMIGNRYYRNDFYNKIQKESYRQVLRIMADDLDAWVSRKKIREKFKGNENTLNNAITALRSRHIILSKEGEKGVYRLQHKGFALWIKLEGSSEAKAVSSEA